MGQIPATTAMPSAKFQNPVNMQDIAANTPFTVTMAIQNLQTGDFVNAQTNYFSAPQQLNAQGQIIGHSHVVIESLSSITQTSVTDPTKFAFFLGLNSPAQNGVLTANVAKGLPAGAYKLSSINTAANHQPVVGPVAQHGSFDDAVYFTVGGAGGATGAAAAAGGAAAGNGASSAASSTAPAASTAAKGAKGGAAAAGNGASSVASSAAPAASTAAKGAKGAKGGAAAAGNAASSVASSAAPAASTPANGTKGGAAAAGNSASSSAAVPAQSSGAAGGAAANGANAKTGAKAGGRRFIRELY